MGRGNLWSSDYIASRIVRVGVSLEDMGG